MRSLVVTLAVLVGFAAGVAAQKGASGASIQGVVMDNNTLPDEVEYWEVRSPTGESVVIIGRRDVSMIRWLRQAKGATALLSVGPPEAAADRSPSALTFACPTSSSVEPTRAR